MHKIKINILKKMLLPNKENINEKLSQHTLYKIKIIPYMSYEDNIIIKIVSNN